MLNSVLTVIVRVVILFLMIAAGYACGKLGAVSKRGAQQLTSILFYVVTPALIIDSLQNMIGKVSLQNLLTAGGLAIFCMVVSILVSLLFFRKSTNERKKVLRFAAAYSNCGFMGLPLAQAVLGDAGVAYASMFLVAFNLLVWTHGYASMSSVKALSWKRIVMNPGLIGFVIGLPLFIFSVRIPELLLSPLSSFSSMNTPLAMIVIGSYISRVNLKEIFQDAQLYLLAAVRLLLIPLVSFAIMLPLGVDKTVATCILILCAAPTGANTVMFAAQFGGDAKLASKAVAFTTLCSMGTMPLSILLAKFL
jgi:predicted permease